MYQVILDSKGKYKSVADTNEVKEILSFFNKRDLNIENFRKYQTEFTKLEYKEAVKNMSRNSSKSMIRNDKNENQNTQSSQNMKSSGSTTNLKNVNIKGRPPKKKNLN